MYEILIENYDLYECVYYESNQRIIRYLHIIIFITIISIPTKFKYIEISSMKLI